MSRTVIVRYVRQPCSNGTTHDNMSVSGQLSNGVADEIEHAPTHGLSDVFHIATGRNHHRSQQWIERGQFAGQAQPVHYGHVSIQQQINVQFGL